MKINFSYSIGTKDDFVTHVPMTTSVIADEFVEEISGDVLEKVPDLIAFIDECYRLLKPGGKAVFIAPHFASQGAWASPITKRAISEASLNFASKVWREQMKFNEAVVLADFEVTGQFAVDQESLNRSDEAKAFWMKRYLNVAQSVIFTLTKK